MLTAILSHPIRFGVILVVLTVVVYFVAGPGSLALRTALLVPHILPSAPVRPLGWFTPTPVVETVQINWSTGSAMADLYRPNDDRVHGAMIIYLGVLPAGREDPRLVRLGDGFARIGIVTLIPESPNLKAGKISEEEIEELIAAFDLLSELEYVDPDRVGVAGFCIGASMAMLAAQDERIRDRIAFINNFDGYLNLEEFVVSIATRSIRPEPPTAEEQREPWEPAPNVTRILVDHLVATLGAEKDRELTLSLLDAGSATQEQISELTPNAQTILRIMWAEDAAEARKLLSDLPPDARALMERLSPDTNLDRLKTKMFIMHDRNDTTVPFVESRRLARALDELGRPSVYTEFDLFKHVDPVQPLEPTKMVGEISRLFWHIYSFLGVIA